MRGVGWLFACGFVEYPIGDHFTSFRFSVAAGSGLFDACQPASAKRRRHNETVLDDACNCWAISWFVLPLEANNRIFARNAKRVDA